MPMKTIPFILIFLNLIATSRNFSAEKSKYAIQRDIISFVKIEPNIDEKNFSSSAIAGKKNVPLAVGLSLLVPGLGEWYANDFSHGKYFMMSEAGLWLTYASFNVYGSWVRDDARNYAKTNAGVSIEGKDDKYFVNVGNFTSLNDYNNSKLLNRQSEKMYLNTAQYFWKWKSDEQRKIYKEMRISSDVAFNNLKFVGTAIAINHILSAINAGMSAVSYNHSLASLPVDVRFSALANPNGIDGAKMTLTTHF
jgi:hypothetical protein